MDATGEHTPEEIGAVAEKMVRLFCVEKYLSNMPILMPALEPEGRACPCGHPRSGHYRAGKDRMPCADWNQIDGKWSPCKCMNHIDCRIAQADRRKKPRPAGSPTRRQIRKVLYLCDEYDLTNAEAAKQIGVSTSTFGVMLHRYRKSQAKRSQLKDFVESQV